jgi:hypothetical protein
MWRHTGAIVRYWYVYRVPRDAFRSFSERYPSYAISKHICGSGLWKKKKKKTKAIRCGACYYSIVLSAHRVTSMVNTDIDAVKKRKNAERIKQYRLKRKLLMQRQASTST